MCKNPIVIDPPGFSQEKAWQECSNYVDQCGGLVNDDGEPNWRAAFGADPGVCSCPMCGEHFWAWGRVQECTECHFQFPTDWWCMYSLGVQAARRNGKFDIYCHDGLRKLHESRMPHAYYRYGFEHPAEDPADQRHKVNWRVELAATP